MRLTKPLCRTSTIFGPDASGGVALALLPLTSMLKDSMLKGFEHSWLQLACTCVFDGLRPWLCGYIYIVIYIFTTPLAARSKLHLLLVSLRRCLGELPRLLVNGQLLWVLRFGTKHPVYLQSMRNQDQLRRCLHEAPCTLCVEVLLLPPCGGDRHKGKRQDTVIQERHMPRRYIS